MNRWKYMLLSTVATAALMARRRSYAAGIGRQALFTAIAAWHTRQLPLLLETQETA